MANIINLKRQHVEIAQLIGVIKGSINKNSIENNADKIAININVLAGKVRIHLDSEDKFLYPELLNSHNEKLKVTAKTYIDTMGDIAPVFMDYKSRFNTKSKILANIGAFKNETNNVLGILLNRLNREDVELYPLISE